MVWKEIAYQTLTRFYLHMYKGALCMRFLILPHPDIGALLLRFGGNAEAGPGLRWRSLVNPKASPLHFPALYMLS